MPLIASAPPASARQKSAGQSVSQSPNATMATPQPVAASITARPWRLTRGVQRAVRLATSAPTAGAA